MPLEGLPWLPKSDILSYEEIADVVAPARAARTAPRCASPAASRRSGRRSHDAVRMLRAVPEIEDIALSTNGVRLPEIARTAARARARSREHERRQSAPGSHRRRSRGAISASIRSRAALAAEAAGLAPIKLNVVVMRGINDDEIEDFARLTLEHPWHVRFIELMPVGDMRELTWEHVVPSDEILARLRAIAPLDAVGRAGARQRPRGVLPPGRARAGTIGVITPMTHTYCASCNRVRLTADGRLRTCLFGDHEVDLRTPLRAGEPLEPFFRDALADKPKEHELLQMTRRRTARALAGRRLASTSRRPSRV